MKKTILLLLSALLVLTSCAPGAPLPNLSGREAVPDGAAARWRAREEAGEFLGGGQALNRETLPGLTRTAVYNAPGDMSQKETIEAYFEQWYRSYTSVAYVDISDIMDMSVQNNKNCLVWMQNLTTRRQLIRQNNYCFVQTQKHPYTIHYISESELKDKRMDSWRAKDANGSGEVSLHFVIKGQEGKAYPPILAVNTQHTIRMKRVNGMWKITFHYFPGAYRKFSNLSAMQVISPETMASQLQKEFGAAASGSAPSTPAGAVPYSAANAARYARTYTEKSNGKFYNIGDWMGNCANFTSQCIWYGFTGTGEDNPSPAGRPNMTGAWYGGTGGGTPAWENVGYFWDYATTSSELGCQELGSASSLKVGDLIQTRNSNASSFNHSLLVVDGEDLVLAQNSPGCFVYYSDLVNVSFRYLRPVYMNKAA